MNRPLNKVINFDPFLYSRPLTQYVTHRPIAGLVFASGARSAGTGPAVPDPGHHHAEGEASLWWAPGTPLGPLGPVSNGRAWDPKMGNSWMLGAKQLDNTY